MEGHFGKEAQILYYLKSSPGAANRGKGAPGGIWPTSPQRWGRPDLSAESIEDYLKSPLGRDKIGGSAPLGQFGQNLPSGGGAPIQLKKNSAHPHTKSAAGFGPETPLARLSPAISLILSGVSQNEVSFGKKTRACRMRRKTIEKQKPAAGAKN